MSRSETARGEVRGVHVLWAMLAFFGAVIAINIAFAVAAVRTFPGEDEPHSYLQGLHFNQTLAVRAAQARLGWSAALSRGADGAISVRLTDRSGLPVSGVRVAAAVRRPATDRSDRQLTFAETAPGLYVAPLHVDPGAWEIKGVATRGDARFEFERRLQWRSSQTR